MVEMTVETDLMSYIVIMNAPIISSNVIAMEDASSVHTNVTVTKIVLTDLTKPTKFAITENVIRKPNSLVRMENVYQSCGNVIMITIVAMIAMNQHIFAETTTVLWVGDVVLDMLTIAASLNGYSVMERMIVEMVQMN